MRCLHCTRKPPRHAAWCREYVGEAPVTPTAIMPAIETDERPAELPVAARSPRRGAPAWSVALVGLGLILAGLSVISIGVLDHLTKGGVTMMLEERWDVPLYGKAKPSNGNERPTQPKPSGGNTRPTAGR